ncbi:MAG: hypothetical protein ACP5NI_06060, partial [Acetobacteraceae bacterium]
VAGQEVLGRGFGRIPAEVRDLAAAVIDASRLSEGQLAMLVEALRAAKAARSQEPPPGEPEGA